jgi:hypothetical protein
MRNVVFGYLFVGKKVRAAAAALQERCRLEYEKPHRALPKLKELRSNLRKLHQRLAAAQVEGDFESAVVLVASGLSASGQSTLIPPHVLESARRLEQALIAPGRAAADGCPREVLPNDACRRERRLRIADAPCRLEVAGKSGCGSLREGAEN